jgi:hypothetical protein
MMDNIAEPRNCMPLDDSELTEAEAAGPSMRPKYEVPIGSAFQPLDRGPPITGTMPAKPLAAGAQRTVSTDEE